MRKIVLRIGSAVIVALLTAQAAIMSAPVRVPAGLLIAVPSFALMIASRRQLGDSFAVKPEARRLVTSGVYRVIQHPMYIFLDLCLAGVIVACGMPWLLAVWSLLVVVQFLQGRREEHLLAAAFGESYAAYARKTWI